MVLCYHLSVRSMRSDMFTPVDFVAQKHGANNGARFSSQNSSKHFAPSEHAVGICKEGAADLKWKGSELSTR
jgi:hypothetical protein